ncbi:MULTISPECIES: CHAD domain-containing protein [unclassified Saccharicrinis]|uniref:CHAD domain-containing protein n=1 Tax=unclassified Saccharicrinis TaxID=2646859 RepID=UPI003D348965
MKRLVRHAGNLLNSFHKNLQKSNRYTDKKDIHNLRLDLKQIFALLKVLDLCMGNISKDFYKSVKTVHKLFKLTGIIRDNQLILKRAKQTLPFKPYKTVKRITDKNIKKASQALEESLEQINIKQVRQDLILGFKETLHVRADMVIHHLKHRINRDEKKISKELAQKETDFHLIRRLVKEQFFLLVTLKEVFGVNVGYSKVAHKEKLGKDLGEWHDWVVCKSKIEEWDVGLDDVWWKLIADQPEKILKRTLKNHLLHVS